MTWLREIILRASALFRGRDMDAEMADEIRLHLELRKQANIEAGMPPDEAEHAARRRFGPVDRVKETCRDERGIVWLENLYRDFLYSARMLRKSPVFAAVALLSLSLGIGANTTIFSLLNAVLLRSLPVRNPGELRAVYWSGHNVELSAYMGSGSRTTDAGGRVSGSFSYAAYRDFRDRSAGLAQLFAFSPLPRCTTTTPDASVAEGLMVSGNFFAAYGAHSEIGRTLSIHDDRAGAPPATVITHRWWERQFGGDPGAVGQSISINRIQVTVVGVLPRDYRSPVPGDSPDFYVPMSLQPQLQPSFPLESYHHWWVEVMARLNPGADERTLRAVLEAVFTQTLGAPGGKTKMNQPRILLEDGSRGPILPREQVLEPISVLMVAVGLLLLIVCANLASLMLARGAARRHEFALRAAIGAGRARLVRQLLVESGMLALAGAALGLLFAAWGRSLLLATLSGSLESFHLDLGSDWRVITFTLAVSLATVLLFGLVPALRATDASPIAGLRDRAAGSGPRLALGKALVTAQVGLSGLLVIGAGLFVQTFARLTHVDPGFNTESLLLFRVSPGQAGYEGEELARFFERANEAVRATAGVRDATFSDYSLLSGAYSSVGIKIPGREVESTNTGLLVVSDSFHSIMGIPLLTGRELGVADGANAPKTAVGNESFAREYFPGENPLGKSVMVGRDEYRIVGVCRDARFKDLRSKSPILYLPFRQKLPGSVVYEVRSHIAPESVAPALRKAVGSVDPAIPLTEARTQTEQIAQLLMMERLFASLCGFLAMLAVLLSCIGLYGLLAYTVTRRTTEVGIRMALGASPRREVGRVVAEGLLMSGAGAAMGTAAALTAGRFIESQLYGVTASDPLTLIASAALLMAVAVVACWVPGRRAARIDPLLALRSE
jgi:predicted permease